MWNYVMRDITQQQKTAPGHGCVLCEQQMGCLKDDRFFACPQKAVSYRGNTPQRHKHTTEMRTQHLFTFVYGLCHGQASPANQMLMISDGYMISKKWNKSCFIYQCPSIRTALPEMSANNREPILTALQLLWLLNL